MDEHMENRSNEPVASGSNPRRPLMASASETNVVSQLLAMDDEVERLMEAPTSEPDVLEAIQKEHFVVETEDHMAVEISSQTKEAAHTSRPSQSDDISRLPDPPESENNESKTIVPDTTVTQCTAPSLGEKKEETVAQTEDQLLLKENASEAISVSQEGHANTSQSILSTLRTTEDVPLAPTYPPIIYPPIDATSYNPAAVAVEHMDVDNKSGSAAQGNVIVEDVKLDGDTARSDTVDDDNIDDASSEVSAGEDLRDDLEDVLKGDFDFKGNYYFAQIAPAAPNPCLNIDGLGPVGLPLSPRDAAAIIECSTRAPFGHGERTVVDVEVRDTWEIEPDRVKFDNPAWEAFIKSTVVACVCQALGVAPRAAAPRCELYKLLLYEAGSHFLPHQDTEKADGMFATVVIVLPSQYTGGEVHVSHATSTKVIDFASSSLLSTAMLAWYTDVVHEVKPITSGYRLALSYNLIHTSTSVPRPALPDMSSSLARLSHVLRKWHKSAYGNDLDTDIIAYLLQHQYNTLNLKAGVKALKGEDAHMVISLRSVAEELGYVVSLANLSYNEHGYAEDSGYSYNKRGRYGYSSDDDDEGTPGMAEVEETSMEIENLVDLDGNLLIGDKKLALDKESLIPKDPFEDASPDETEYEGYMGNGAGSLDHWYHRTVLVLFHEDDGPRLLFSAGGVDYALQTLKKSESTIPAANDKIMANLVVDALNAHGKATAATMADYAVKWKDLDMWRTVIKKSSSLIATFGRERLVQAWKTFGFENVHATFDDLLLNSPRLRDRIEFIQSIPLQASPDDRDHINKWAEEQYSLAFASFKSPVIEDIPVLIAAGRIKGAVFLLNEILPQIVKNTSTYTFLAAFVRSLDEHKDSISEAPATNSQASQPGPAMGNDNYDSLVEQSLAAAVTQWDAVIAQLANPVYGGYGYRYAQPQQPSASQQSRISRIIELVELCILTGHMTPCKNLFLVLLRVQDTAEKKFETLYTPLLPRLRNLLREKGVDVVSSPFADFFQLLIGSYLRNVLKGHNYQPKFRKIGCGCGDCSQLDVFMNSLTATQTFRLAQARRYHLETRLNAANDLVSFVTVRSGSPHGVCVTKRPQVIASMQWNSRVAQAKNLLRDIGGDDDIARLMGNRYADVLKALQGTQQFALTVGDAVKKNPADCPTAAASSSSQGSSSLPASAPSGLSSATPTGSFVAGKKRKKTSLVSLGPVIDLTGEDSS